MMRAPRIGLVGVMFFLTSVRLASGQTPIAPQRPITPRTPAAPVSVPPPAKAPAAPSVRPAPASAPARLPESITRMSETPAPAADRLKFTQFDPMAAEVRRTGKSWELWAGKTRLKDFGDDRRAAYDARRLIAELRLTEYAAIGTNGPVMEVWLTEGQAPPLPGFAREVIPFDPESLRVIDDRGSFLIANDRQVLFNFGPYPDDAQQALAIIQQYGFNELGFIGSPNPRMSYLLKNGTPRRQLTPAVSRLPQALPQLTPRQALEIPGWGRVGERTPIDPIKLDLRRTADGWHLISAPFDLGPIATSEHQARIAMQMVQRFPLTEQVRIGKEGFVFYLSHGAAPRGVPLGARRIPIQVQELAVREQGPTVNLTDGRRILASFSSADEAQLALAAIRHFGLNCICEIGSGFRILVKD